ncbi:MAG: pitrilysin family protein [Candidatus Aureabacteria bacterium]|nr:pitrilysin family protein [Candidatus Auribacterota bacterium]
MKDPLYRYHTTALDGGLRAVTCEMPAMESAAIGIWIGIGGRYEEAPLNGISHFLEHLLFKGTATRSALRISQEIESVGGALNGFTGEEYTCYMAKVPHAHLRRAAEVLADMCTAPALRGEDIEKERAVIREEINMYRDTPQHHVVDLLGETLWSGHPLGRPLAGTPESVGAITRAHLRQHHAGSYTPQNMVCAAAGAVRHDLFCELMVTLLASRARSRPPRFAPAPRGARRAVRVERKKTEQSHLCLGIRGYSREHPDRYALQMLSIIMGENMSSRLFQRIRERHGLAYAINSSVTRYRDTGAFSIYAGVEHAKALKALALIVKELALVRDRGVGAAELRRARVYWTGQLSMELEKTAQTMLCLGEQMICSGKILTKEAEVANIRRVGVQDIRRVAADLFTERGLNLAAIGPFAETDEDVMAALRMPGR